MAKSSKDRDRRAVVEAMRRDQKRSERRRTYAVVAACVVVGGLIIALGAYPLLRQRQQTDGALGTIGVPAGQAGCRDLVTKPANGNQDHKPVGTKIFYKDAPPAFGPHYPQPAPFDRKFYTAEDRPQLEYLVHNLEHGYNLLWYDETVADNPDELAVVKAISSKFEGQKLTDKFIAVPWTKEDGKPFPGGAHVALTHWSVSNDPADRSKQKGVWQYCAKPSGAVVQEFVKDWPFTDSPEPQAM
jgi:hypothetical protein